MITTAHSLCWTDECFDNIARTGGSILSFVAGERPRYVVNTDDRLVGVRASATQAHYLRKDSQQNWGCDYPSTAIYRHPCQSDFASRHNCCASVARASDALGYPAGDYHLYLCSFVYQAGSETKFRDAFRLHSLVISISPSALILWCRLAIQVWRGCSG